MLQPEEHINSSSIKYSYLGLGQMTVAKSTHVLTEVKSCIYVYVFSVLQHQQAIPIQT